MANEQEGRTEYVRRRLAVGAAQGELKRTEDELENEGIPRGTISAIKSEMKKRGELPEDSGVSLVSMKRQFPQKLGRYDVLTPEAVLQELRLQDGDYKVGFVDGIAMLLLAARLNQELANTQTQAMMPMINMLRAMREEEQAAAERARGSSMDIAREAAQEAASGVAAYFDQRRPPEPPSRDWQQMFVKRIERMWDLMEYMQTQRMFPGYQAGKAPEGWEVQNMRSEDRPDSPDIVGGAAPARRGVPEGWEETTEANTTREESNV